jgi:hypothetical protein
MPKRRSYFDFSGMVSFSAIFSSAVAFFCLLFLATEKKQVGFKG